MLVPEKQGAQPIVDFNDGGCDASDPIVPAQQSKNSFRRNGTILRKALI